MERKGIAFMGKITAGITHEMNNVLAIIRESGGLLEDIMAMKRDGEFEHKDKFSMTLSRIKDQTNRGMEINRHLNKFAHSMDAPVTSVILKEILEEAVSLNNRFARLKKIGLRISDEVDPALSVNSDPFSLIMLLSNLIDELLGRSREGGEIVLYAAKTENQKTVEIMAEPADEQADYPKDADIAVDLARHLDVNVDAAARASGSGFCVTFN